MHMTHNCIVDEYCIDPYKLIKVAHQETLILNYNELESLTETPLVVLSCLSLALYQESKRGG